MEPGCRRSIQRGTSLLELILVLAVIAILTGALTTLNYGFFGRDFGAQADGRRVRREWPYYASNPRARVIVTGADLAEHFSRTFDVPSSPYGTVAVLVAAMAGDRLVLADAHKLTAYTFAP